MQFVIQCQMNLAVCSAAGWRNVGQEKLRERERGALKTKIHKMVENAHHYAPNKFLFQDNGQPCDSSGSSDSVKQKG